MSDSRLIPPGISLESRIVELEEPSPWLCTICGGAYETAPRGGRPSPQRCACQRDAQGPPWPGYDFNTHVELCQCCGRVPLLSGSRFSVWFCPGCLADVLKLNASAGRTAVPLGRHSALHGRLVCAGGSKEEVERDTRALVEWMGEFTKAVNSLQSFFRSQLSRLLAIDGRREARRVRLSGFVERLGRSEDPGATRRAAFELLCRRFGFRLWRNGDITEAPKLPEVEDDGDEAYEKLTGACPLCHATYGCSHHLITYDATFPGEPSEGPIEWQRLREVYAAAWRLVAALERDRELDGDVDLKRRLVSLGGVPKRLFAAAAVGYESLEYERSEYAGNDDVDLSDDDPQGRVDVYAMNAQLSEYLEEVFGGCPGRYLGSSRHEDCIPMASSAYSNHWAHDGEACADAAEETIAADIALLDELREGLQ